VINRLQRRCRGKAVGGHSRLYVGTDCDAPAPWMFADRMCGLGNCLIDRDGRVIGANLLVGNGPLIAQAPAMAALLRAFVAGASSDDLRERAARILGRIDHPRTREPGEDDE
jgi:hypothetical protein